MQRKLTLSVMPRVLSFSTNLSVVPLPPLITTAVWLRSDRSRHFLLAKGCRGCEKKVSLSTANGSMTRSADLNGLWMTAMSTLRASNSFSISALVHVRNVILVLGHFILKIAIADGRCLADGL